MKIVKTDKYIGKQAGSGDFDGTLDMNDAAHTNSKAHMFEQQPTAEKDHHGRPYKFYTEQDNLRGLIEVLNRLALRLSENPQLVSKTLGIPQYEVTKLKEAITIISEMRNKA